MACKSTATVPNASRQESLEVDSFSMGGWTGYNDRLNGKYDPVYGQFVNGRPVYSHLHTVGVGGNSNWCRMWWSGGCWRIGHVLSLDSDLELAVALCASDADVPAKIDPTVPWMQHHGECMGKDQGKDPCEFKAAPGVYVYPRTPGGRATPTRGVVHRALEHRLTWMASQERAVQEGGRLLTLDEARRYLGGVPLYPGEDQWCAVTDAEGERDWVQVGSALHSVGKSHKQDCFTYPPWGDDLSNTTYGRAHNRALLFVRLPSTSMPKRDAGAVVAYGEPVGEPVVSAAVPSSVMGKVVSL